MDNRYLGLPSCIRSYAIALDNFCKYVSDRFFELIDDSGFKKSDLYDEKGNLNELGTFLVSCYVFHVYKKVLKQYEYQLVGEYLKKHDL